MNYPVNPLHAEIAALREQLDVAHEELRQLRELMKPHTAFPLSWRLTAREAQVLGALLGCRGDYLHKEQLFAIVWGPDAEVTLKGVDVHLHKLRKKLAPVGISIVTVWGRGYALSAEDRATLRAYAEGRPVELAPVSSVFDPEPEDLGEPQPRPWSPVEIRTLRAYRAVQYAPGRIAALLNRSVAEVREQCAALSRKRAA